MRPTPKPPATRRNAARFLMFLLALAPFAGCDCPNKAPLAPIVVPPLSAVVVSPGSDTLRIGDHHQFSAVAYDTLGQPTGSVIFTWTSSDPQVFAVDPNGRVTGVGEGLAKLFVEAAGRRDTAVVSVYPDTAWFAQVSGTTRNLLGVFFQDDGRSGWAVGTGGALIHTTDAGQIWSVQTSGTSSNLNSVWFTGPDEGWAVGNGGTVLHTLNGGLLWTRVNVSAGENLMDVCFADPSLGWIVGSNGAVLRTTDGGASWDKRSLTGTILQSVSSSGLDVWAVSSGGEIFGTHDGGAIWFRVQPAITIQSIKSVWRRSAAGAWTAGSQGVTPRTVVTPDSVAWELRNAGAANQLEGVHFPTDLIGYAVGYNGAGLVLRTDDAGLTWQNQASHTSRRLNAVYFVDALRGWAVGDGGVIVHTARGGLR
jgi:photosystem II stability/assembly factor-like uncharacterized protein